MAPKQFHEPSEEIHGLDRTQKGIKKQINPFLEVDSKGVPIKDFGKHYFYKKSEEQKERIRNYQNTYKKPDYLYTGF